MGKLYLIDGNSLAYRAFYAIPSLTTSKGKPTNAIYGFVVMLLKILKEEKPDYLAILFDSKTPTFRHNIFPKYKIHRKKMPEEMFIQMPVIHKVIKSLGCFYFSIDGYEADDLIASFVKKFKDDCDEIFIFTQDKDILSLIAEKIRVISSKKGISERTIFNREKTIEKFGVSPERIPDLLSLIGDSSDNIPGAKGIGEKTGASLIKRYESVDTILNNLPNIENKKIREIIRKERQMIELSRELVKLKDDISLPLSLSSLKIKEFDKESLFSLFLELEFKTLIKELSLKIERQEEILFSQIPHSKAVSLFPSGDGLIVCDGKSSFLSPFGDAKEILEDETIEKIGYDIKSFLVGLKNKGMDLKGDLFDIMLSSYLLNPGLKQGLDDVFIRHLPSEASDCMGIFRAKGIMEEKLKEQGLFDVFSKLEMPVVRVLSDMEISGIRVDKEYLLGLKDELTQKISSLQEKIYSFGEFNINSPKQLSFILFEKLHLPIKKRLKTGPSTNEEVLTFLSKIHPLPKFILEYRELAKLKSTYIDGIIGAIKEDGRVHCEFNQAITATGRLSSSNPNLQNIPIRTELGKKIRRAFIADEGNLLLKADYSQIELRILAHISQDSGLVSSFKQGEDIHFNTAQELYSTSKITEEMRRQAKTVNFGIVYGMSSYGLSKELGISVLESQEMIDRYFSLHPGVLRYIEETKERVRELGYVETLWGRKRYIPDVFSPNKQIREFGERAAINMPIQGTCADVIKKAMIDVNKRLPQQAKLLLQVHDELLFEIKREEASQIAPIVIESMENAGSFDVPIEVNISIGKNWGEL